MAKVEPCGSCRECHVLTEARFSFILEANDAFLLLAEGEMAIDIREDTNLYHTRFP